MLVFSYNQSKPKAFAPLAFLAAIGVGMAAETLVTMGVKAGSKAILKKQAQNYSDDIVRAGKFDWAGTNPYRNKDGSITLSPSANDRAKMAGLISGSLVGTMVGDDFLGNPYDKTEGHNLKVCPPPETLLDYEPFQLSFIRSFDKSRADYPVYLHETANTNTLFSFYTKKVADQLHIKVIYNVTGLEMYSNVVTVSSDDIHGNIINAHDDYFDFGIYDGTKRIAFDDRLIKKSNMNSPLYENLNAFDSAGSQLYNCNGLFYPDTMERVYPAPMNMSNDFVMPNFDLLDNKPFVIYNVFPPSDNEGSITWEELERYFNGNMPAFDEIMDNNIDNYLEKGDINNHYYTIGEINNIYTDIEQQEKIEDFNPPLISDKLPGIPDSGEIIPVDPIDRSLLQIAKESYQYLADTVKSSVDGLTAVTAGATGVITFLGTTMGWLPNEWIVMFSAAFGLGLFAFFFRR